MPLLHRLTPSDMITRVGEIMSNDADLRALEQLNCDYIDSVQHGDVRRFDQILAPEFYCSNPDGSLLDRAGFLEQTAKPVTISGLEALDVQIRLMGDLRSSTPVRATSSRTASRAAGATRMCGRGRAAAGWRSRPT